MTETNEWSTAPKDGSEINIQFPDGTKARARWNAENGGEWQAQRATVNGREWPTFTAPVIRSNGGASKREKPRRRQRRVQVDLI